jgi:cytochrome c553
MKKIIASLVLVMGVAGVAQAEGDAVAGQEKSMLCAGCHGVDGNSVVPTFPKLSGQGEKYLVKQINDIKTGNRAVPEMTGLLDNMTDQDIQDVASYFASQKTSLEQAKADLVEKGQSIYRAGNMATGLAACTACHAPNGEGNGPAAFPALSGQHSVYVAAQLKKFRSGERTNDGDASMMRDIASKLSDSEIEAVSSYISGLH